MLITLEVVSKLLDHLKPHDRLGIITFDSKTSVIQPMKKLIQINIENLKSELLKIFASGGTNLSAAIDCCGSLLDCASKDYNNRIVFLTDAQPNQGDLEDEKFLLRIEQLAKKCIYTTFLGVGIDLNTQLISSITKNRGANYFSKKNDENLNDWEQQSTELIVSKQYQKLMRTFLTYFESEMILLNDKDLEQEVKILNKLIDYEH